MREELSGPARALAEMRARDERNGVDPRSFTAVPSPPAPPPPPGIRELLAASPPDWEAELAERARLEREQQQQERARIVAEELERIAPEDTETRPAKPRLTAARAMLDELKGTRR